MGMLPLQNRYVKKKPDRVVWIEGWWVEWSRSRRIDKRKVCTYGEATGNVKWQTGMPKTDRDVLLSGVLGPAFNFLLENWV